MLVNYKNKPVLLSVGGSFFKEIKFDKFKFGADQIMLISGGKALQPWQMIELRCMWFAQKFSLGEIYRQSRSVR